MGTIHSDDWYNTTLLLTIHPRNRLTILMALGNIASLTFFTYLTL